MTVLLREAIGDRLRHARTNQRRTLRDISRAARVSLGYLSEVERGQKEASSELLASICGALELPLAELLHTVASDISSLEALDTPALDAPALDSKALDGKSMRSLEESRLSANHSGPSVPTRRSALETSAVEANTFSGRVVSGKPHSSNIAGAVAPALRTTIKPPKLATSAA